MFVANIANCVKDHDVSKYSCASNYTMINEEQLCTSKYGIVSGMQEDKSSNSNDISNDFVPIEQRDIAQTNIEYDVGSLHVDPIEQYYDANAIVNQFPNMNALVIEQSDVRKCLWIEDMVAPTKLPLPTPYFDDMIDSKEDYCKDDVSKSLWIEDMEGVTTILFPILEYFDSIEQYYDTNAMKDYFPYANALTMEQSDVSECLWIEDMIAAKTIPFPTPDFDDIIDPNEDSYKNDVSKSLWIEDMETSSHGLPPQHSRVTFTSFFSKKHFQITSH